MYSQQWDEEQIIQAEQELDEEADTYEYDAWSGPLLHWLDQGDQTYDRPCYDEGHHHDDLCDALHLDGFQSHETLSQLVMQAAHQIASVTSHEECSQQYRC